MASIVLGLSKWYEALAVGTARAVVIGDSISEGTGATDGAKRWQTLLQKRFSQSGPTFPFLPAMSTSPVPLPVVRSGNVVANASYGLGWRTAVLQDTGVVTFTFSGTSAEVMFVRGTVTGVMSVTVDGGPAVVVDTNATTSGLPSNNAALWSTGPLANGTHTVSISRHASSGSGQHPYVQGLLTYAGDETTGVRVLDGAHHGWASSTMNTSSRVEMAQRAITAAGGRDLLVMAWGTNDTVAPTSAENYRANLQAMIDRLRNFGGFTGAVLLVNMYKGNTLNEGVYSQYGQQMAAIAAANADVAYLDLRKYMPDVPTPYSAPAGLGYYADSLHPSDAGNARMAEIIGAALTATLIDITAELVTSAGSPAPVRIVVDGVPPGAEYAVMGSTGGGSSWAVPGGAGVGDGGQIVLVDNRAALNTPVTYSVVVGGVTYTADPVTVAHDGRAVLQSLDGLTSVDFVWLSNSLPREPQINTATFNVPGRRRPPVRYAPGGDGGGELLIRADRSNSEAIRELLYSGRPILVRTDGTMRDWPAVELITLVAAPSSLWEAVEAGQLSTQRVWSLSFLFADDPEPSRVLSAWTWDDFDLAAAASFDTWDEFDALFAGQTWDDFDTTDWGQYQ